MRIRHKLKSENGVTILFAQLAFMVAMVVSIVILTAAISSQKRVYNDREEQQSHLNLSSAAGMVREELNGTTTHSVTVCKRDAAGNLIDTPEANVSATGLLKKEIIQAVLYVNRYDSVFRSGDHGCDFTVSIEGLDLPAIHASMIMERIGAVEDPTTIYQATFTFTVEGSNETLYLKMDATTHTENNIVTNADNTTTVTSTQSFLWNVSNITAMGE